MIFLDDVLTPYIDTLAINGKFSFSNGKKIVGFNNMVFIPPEILKSGKTKKTNIELFVKNKKEIEEFVKVLQSSLFDGINFQGHIINLSVLDMSFIGIEENGKFVYQLTINCRIFDRKEKYGKRNEL